MKVRIPEIHEAFACIVMLWIMNPMSYAFYNPFILVILTVCWTISAFMNNNRVMLLSIKDKSFWVSLVYPAVLLIYHILGHSAFENNSVIVPVIVLIWVYYFKLEDKAAVRLLVGVVLTYMILVAVNTLIALQSNPNIARLLAAGDTDYIVQWASPLIGNYGTVYCVMLIVIGIWGMVFMNIRRREKIVWFVIFVVFCIFLIRAQYTISMLFATAGICILTFIIQRKSTFKMISLCIGCTVLLIVFIIGLPTLFYSVASLFQPGFLQNRFIQVGDLFAGVSASNNGAYVRFDLYMISWNTFLRYPYFGAGNLVSMIDGARRIGGHSLYFDALGRYGIFGGIALLGSRLYLIIQVLKRMKGKHIAIYSTIALIFFVLGWLNPTNRNEFMVTMILLIPFLLIGWGNENYFGVEIKNVKPESLLNKPPRLLT